jgi:electron transport complex protein RnfG
MKEYLKMVAVLTAIAAVCGFLLAAVKKGTEKRIEEQILMNVQGPAVNSVLATSTNDLLGDRQEIAIDDQKYLVFVGKKEGKIWAFCFENSGKGYGGDIGVMVGFDINNDKLTGIGILSHKETPGLGARVTEETFTNNFKGKALTETFKVKKDNGVIDAISGATYSSRAVCIAVEKCIAVYPKIKDKLSKEKKE